MRILIIGNMGYIGPSVVSHLRTILPNLTVVGVDMGYFADCLTNSAFFPECKVDLQYFCDVRKMPQELLEDLDAIVHLAAISNDPMGNIFEEVTLEVNHRASVSLAARTNISRAWVSAVSCGSTTRQSR